MTVKVAINGFGRIGRNILRAIVESGRTDIEVVAINDLGPVETNAHLLRYDSVHGRFPAEVVVDGDTITIRHGGRTIGPIRVSAERDPSKVPYGGVDVAMECTGRFTSNGYTLPYQGCATRTWAWTSRWNAPAFSPRARRPRCT